MIFHVFTGQVALNTASSKKQDETNTNKPEISEHPL
jgi:hypothetical protein